MNLVKRKSLNKNIFNSIFYILCLIHTNWIKWRICCRKFKIIISVNTSDFFNNICLQADILCCTI